MKRKNAVFLTAIGTKTYTLLRNLIAPAKPSEKNYDDLVDTLKAHLEPKPMTIAERFKFHKRNQLEGETIAQYLAELRRLMQHCDFQQYLEQALHNRLVCGIRSEAIQKRLLAVENLTLAQAQELAMSMEAAAKHASELQGGASSKELELFNLPAAAGKTCYRCGGKGHVPDKCYFKTQKCKICSKQGHIAKVCRSKMWESKGRAPQRDTKPPKGQLKSRNNHFMAAEKKSVHDCYKQNGT